MYSTIALGEAGRDRVRAGGVELAGDFHEAAQQARRHRGALDHLLVVQAPHEHAGVVAVAADQLGEVGEALLVRLQPAVLVEHEHAQPVARVEQFRRRRVVRGAVGVAAELLQAADAVLVGPVGQGDADAGEVLVAAHPVDRGEFAVQQEAVGAVLDGADAERVHVRVDGLAALAQFGVQVMEHGCCEAPQLGTVDRHPLADVDPRVGRRWWTGRRCSITAPGGVSRVLDCASIGMVLSLSISV
jgi:hypothetical protein